MQSQTIESKSCSKEEELIGITRALSNQANALEILLSVLQDLEGRMSTILRQEKENCSSDTLKTVSTDSILATKVHTHNEKIQTAIDVVINLNRLLDV